MNSTLRLQKALTVAGFPCKLDGQHGPKTEAQFQAWKASLATKKKGPDLSSYNVSLNIPELARNCDFSYLRASASLSLDSVFKSRWKGFREAGIKRGAYHFFTPWQDPIKQAENFVTQLGNDLGELPLALDVEAVASKPKPNVHQKTVTPSQLIESSTQCLEALEVLTGVKPCFYTYSAFDAQYRLGSYFGADYALWIADYREGPPTYGIGWRSVLGHQYAGNDGSWVGVKGPCDCNRLL